MFLDSCLKLWATVFCSGYSDWSENNMHQGKQLAAANRQCWWKFNMGIGYQPKLHLAQSVLDTFACEDAGMEYISHLCMPPVF